MQANTAYHDQALLPMLVNPCAQAMAKIHSTMAFKLVSEQPLGPKIMRDG